MGKKNKPEEEVKVEAGNAEHIDLTVEKSQADVEEIKEVPDGEHFNASIGANVVLKDPSHAEPTELGVPDESVIVKVKEEDFKPQAEPESLPGRPEAKDHSHLKPMAEPEPKEKPKIKDPKHLKPQE